jgi:hypothetical protein
VAVGHCCGAEASYLGSDCDRIKDGCRGVTQSFKAGVQLAFCFESLYMLYIASLNAYSIFGQQNV